MKIATWNINSVRIRLNHLETLALEQKPDIICLQETKVQDSLFPASEIRNLGYNYLFYSGQKAYNGVAILSKIPFEDPKILSFFNDDKRHVSVKVGDIELHNFYIPAGGDVPNTDINPKFKHKLSYIDLMQKWLMNNRTVHDKLILVGDLNIAPHEHDVWSSKALKNVVSHTDVEREALLGLQKSMDFIDSARHFVPFDQKLYTWWSYRSADWQESNRGRRLDHVWVSKNLENHMESVESVIPARGWERTSDHVPYILKMR